MVVAEKSLGVEGGKGVQNTTHTHQKKEADIRVIGNKRREGRIGRVKERRSGGFC